jgi:hypothetical protein
LGLRRTGPAPITPAAYLKYVSEDDFMNRFGEIADELTDLIEELDHPDLADFAQPLRQALERAFIRACEAERRVRLESPARVPGKRPALVDRPDQRTAVVIAFAERRRGATCRGR